MRPRLYFVLIAAGFALAAAGCGGGEKPAASGPPLKLQLANLDRPGAADFFVGEHFEVTIHGPASAPVSVGASQNGSKENRAPYGTTDQNGNFTLRGQIGPEHVGLWREVWYAGDSTAPAITFEVKRRP